MKAKGIVGGSVNLGARVAIATSASEAAQRSVHELERIVTAVLENIMEAWERCLAAHDDLLCRLKSLEQAAEEQGMQEVATKDEVDRLEMQFQTLKCRALHSFDSLFDNDYEFDSPNGQTTSNYGCETANSHHISDSVFFDVPLHSELSVLHSNDFSCPPNLTDINGTVNSSLSSISNYTLSFLHKIYSLNGRETADYITDVSQRTHCIQPVRTESLTHDYPCTLKESIPEVEPYEVIEFVATSAPHSPIQFKPLIPRSTEETKFQATENYNTPLLHPTTSFAYFNNHEKTSPVTCSTIVPVATPKLPSSFADNFNHNSESKYYDVPPIHPFAINPSKPSSRNQKAPLQVHEEERVFINNKIPLPSPTPSRFSDIVFTFLEDMPPPLPQKSVHPVVSSETRPSIRQTSTHCVPTSPMVKQTVPNGSTPETSELHLPAQSVSYESYSTPTVLPLEPKMTLKSQISMPNSSSEYKSYSQLDPQVYPQNGDDLPLRCQLPSCKTPPTIETQTHGNLAPTGKEQSYGGSERFHNQLLHSPSSKSPTKLTSQISGSTTLDLTTTQEQHEHPEYTYIDLEDHTNEYDRIRLEKKEMDNTDLENAPPLPPRNGVPRTHLPDTNYGPDESVLTSNTTDPHAQEGGRRNNEADHLAGYIGLITNNILRNWNAV